MKRQINFKFKICVMFFCMALSIGFIAAHNVSAESLDEKTPVISDSYVRGVNENLLCADFKEIYTEEIHGSEYKVYDLNGNNVTVSDVSTKISTGFYIKDGKDNCYTIIVTGDLTGDGKVDTSDTATLKLHFALTYTLKDSQAEAADTNNDGRINIADYMRIKYHIQSKYNIHQDESFEPDPDVSDDESNGYDESGWTSGWE